MASHFLPIDKAQDGTIKNGKALRAIFDVLPVGLSMMEITIVNRHSRQSDGYYFKVVLSFVQRGLKALGHDDIQDVYDAHQFCKKLFNKGKTTSDMNDADFNNYVERVCKFAAEELKETIPEPKKFVS